MFLLGIRRQIETVATSGAKTIVPLGVDGLKSDRSGPGGQSATPPNTRVQRTRSSASPPHSPLTRRPLGRYA